MDPAEIIKAAPQAVKVVGAIAAAVPGADLVKRMLGPAADELGEMWKDNIRLYRYRHEMKCLEKAAKMAKKAGLSPQPVPPKILFPLLEGASMEDDEVLHDMWASLLANASTRGSRLVRPSFIALLRDMASDEAVVLHYVSLQKGDPRFVVEPGKDEELGDRKIFKWRNERMTELAKELFDNLPEFEGEPDHLKLDRYETCLHSLERAGLITSVSVRVGHGTGYLSPCTLTSVGRLFVALCSPPKPKS